MDRTRYGYQDRETQIVATLNDKETSKARAKGTGNKKEG